MQKSKNKVRIPGHSLLLIFKFLNIEKLIEIQKLNKQCYYVLAPTVFISLNQRLKSICEFNSEIINNQRLIRQIL